MSDHNAQQYRAAIDTVTALLAASPRAAAATGDDTVERARVADLRHVRTMLYRGRSDQQVVDQLASLCPCSRDPEADGPEQDCPIHGDGVSFVDLCRWRDRVVGGAHALLGALDTDRPDVAADVPAVNRFRELLDAGPWASPMPGRQPATDVELNDVMAAWLDLLEANPDARTLGGPRSHTLWAALDRLVETPDADGQPG